MLLACGTDRATIPLTESPVAPSSAPVPPSIPGPGMANFLGHTIVTSRTGPGGCGWGTAVGEQRHNVRWRVTRDGGTVLLEADMDNWPTDHLTYVGTLDGDAFNASYRSGDDYLAFRCQFRGGELTGRFAGNGESFDALETLYWGPPEAETKVQRRWTVKRWVR